jgi:RNA ligase (TIGR02306 family)
MRKLASIQKISKLEPIEGADSIVKATVLGWQLVVKKDEFNIGDLCVYCEIDSILPEKPEFEFLKPRKMRIRTIKLRGQISQGICFPLSILPPDVKIEEGKDVTDILGITKYEPPIPASLEGIAKGKFPSFIPKTDEARVQVLQDILDKYKGETFFYTEKLDGSSATYYLYDGQFGVCSRNLELIETEENTLWKLAREHKIEEKLKSLNKNYAIQGEIIGESVQSNKYNLRGQDIWFFNVYDIDEHRFLDFEEFVFFFKNLNLKTVPVLETNYELSGNIEELVRLSVGKSVLNDVQREGIVLRPLKEIEDSSGRISFKAINPKFLLKYE